MPSATQSHYAYVLVGTTEVNYTGERIPVAFPPSEFLRASLVNRLSGTRSGPLHAFRFLP